MSTPPTHPPPWTKQQTIDLLTADPLPPTFRWLHKDGGQRPVTPSHERLRGGFGKWLAEGPQFPGLFELINDILTDADQPEAGTAWLASDALRTQMAAIEVWSQFLVLELSALRLVHEKTLAESPGEPPAHVLRRVRTRPPEPTALF